MSKGEQTRQHIIAEAASVFNTRGFFGTSMRDLAQATGLEKGGIYNHFASKEALALAAFDNTVAQIGNRFLAARAQHEHALDQLVALVEVFGSIIAAPVVPGGCPVLNTAVEADDAHPALRERAQHAMTAWRTLIGSTVKQGVQRGELRPDADPYDVAVIVAATLEGAIMLSSLYDDASYLHRAVAHVTHYLHALAV